ncbi:MAG: hypothetical protein LBL80_06345 [Ruminococcus sp.]|nr:hypothetical protein [Ruminococcus sp.]
MDNGIVYSGNESKDFDKKQFEAGFSKSMSDFAHFLKTGDRSKFKPMGESLSEWKRLADEVRKEEIFIATIKAEDFNYTEWRQKQPWINTPIDEIVDIASSYIKNNPEIIPSRAKLI